MARPRLSVLPLWSELHGRGDDLAAAVAGAFSRNAQVDLVPDPEGALALPVRVLLVLTGGTEQQALAVAGKEGPGVVLLSHPGHNSLPAGLEIAARLRSDGRAVRLVHLGANDDELLLVARVIQLARALRGKRIGLVGEPSPWLVASSPSPTLFEETLGIEVLSIPLERVLRMIPPAPASAVDGPGLGISQEEREMGARVHEALRRLVAEEELDGLTVACFGLLPHRMTACWGLACLSDAGIPGGCEGDLPSLLGLLVARELTGGPGFLANPADVDPKHELLTLAHCTVPLGLTRSHTLRTHFESGLGLAVAGELDPGPYTLVRFGGRDLRDGFFVEGTVLDERVGREDLCRTQVLFKMPHGAIRKLLAEPLGNHHVLIPGHHRPTLSLFHQLFLAD